MIQGTTSEVSVSTNMVNPAEDRENLTLCCQDHIEEDAFLERQWKMGSISPQSVHVDLITRPEKSELHINDLLQAVDSLNALAAMDPEDYRHMLLEGGKSWSCLASVDYQPQLLRLYQNIHRLHSMIGNLTAENDAQTVDLLQLYETIRRKDERMGQLEAAVTKLHKRNQKLKQRSQSDQSRAQKLVKLFKDVAATKHKNENDLLTLQLLHHEQILLRERNVSNYSDMDGLQDCILDGDSVVSFGESVSTATPSLYSDAIATVRISRVRSSTWPPLDMGSIDTVDTSKGTSTYPFCRVRGLPATECSDPSVVLDGEESDKAKQRQPQNPFAVLLGPRHVQPYTLQLLHPYELQFVALLVTGSNGEEETAFAVCGYYGFEVALNVKPTLGARLLRVNKEDLNPDWTVHDLERHIRALGPTASMTFRNDSWPKNQRDILREAIQEHERLNHRVSIPGGTAPALVNPVARIRTQSDPCQKNKPLRGKHVLGFLNLPGRTSKVKNDLERDKPMTLQVCDRESSDATTKTSGFKTNEGSIEEKPFSRTLNEIAQASKSEDEDGVTSDEVAMDMDNCEGSTAMPNRCLPTASKANQVDAGKMIKASLKQMGKLFEQFSQTGYE